jgi:hypothetical protein
VGSLRALTVHDPRKQIFLRRDTMPIYISRGRYTSNAVKGMLAKPEDREEAIA